MRSIAKSGISIPRFCLSNSFSAMLFLFIFSFQGTLGSVPYSPFRGCAAFVFPALSPVGVAVNSIKMPKTSVHLYVCTDVFLVIHRFWTVIKVCSAKKREGQKSPPLSVIPIMAFAGKLTLPFCCLALRFDLRLLLTLRGKDHVDPLWPKDTLDPAQVIRILL